MRAMIAFACVALLCAATITAQRTQPAGTRPLPALSMTCTVHPEVVEARPGACPVCKRALVPVRLESAWMCPIHAAVMEEASGACRICRRDLIRVTVSLTWSCRGDAAVHLEPGRCADGTPRIARRTLRPHGNHNPKYGGQFFMAPDNWHHLEGTYPADRVFRLYVYDDYARPLPPVELRQVTARVVTEELFDPATRKTKEVRSFPLRAARDGAYLEARVDEGPLPRDMTAKIRLGDSRSEYRFDFTFTELTRPPAVPVSARAAQPAATPAATTRPARAAAPARPAPSAAAATPPTDPAVDVAAPPPDPALAELPVASSMEDMLTQMRTRLRHVGELIERGNLEAVYVPAFHAKDLAVALEPHLAHLPPARRDSAGPALERVVRTAWLLDAFGDTGNRPQVIAAYAAFTAAVNEVLSAFEAPQ